MAALASRQHGVVSRIQLVEIGFEPRAIDRRVEAGRLHPVHRGVYLVGHRAAPPYGREMAAVLACGQGAVASHRSAAHLWALLPYPAGFQRIEITVPDRDPGNKPGIRVHPTARFDRRDIRTCRGIPVTTPARTLLDLAAGIRVGQRAGTGATGELRRGTGAAGRTRRGRQTVSGPNGSGPAVRPRQLEHALAEAERRGLVGARDLRDLLGRSGGRRGVAALRALIDDANAANLTRSEAEERLLALIREADLPPPELNVTSVGTRSTSSGAPST